MVSGLLIVLAVIAGFIWGEEFLLAPQWFRITFQVSLAAILFAAVALDWSRRE